MEIDWEADLGRLLAELSAVQGELLAFLGEKRKLLSAADTLGLVAMQQRERALTVRLEQCHQRRGELLAQADAQGLPCDSLRALEAALPRAQRQALDDRLRQAAAQSRLLQHHSLTNWVLAQRTLLHLAQLLEIIGTKGRPSPTYGKGEPCNASGALVDHAA